MANIEPKLTKAQIEAAVDKMIAKRLKRYCWNSRPTFRTTLKLSATKTHKLKPFIPKRLQTSLNNNIRQQFKSRQRKTTARLSLWAWAKRRQSKLRTKPSIQRGCRRVRKGSLR